ncbi:hypothetical protein OS242_10375 [Tumebacillus sp. DT12]|uniref:Uncharacterized protein n=1 Tax=Tumebacillus lacus TaxID=2995335 RepID=A0ABT3X0D9_9BACL|nr:hypothetical protein [Tumebacillus lacus]MCX7570369.1 hypothetical protein [Tumebacillus lacus]
MKLTKELRVILGSEWSEFADAFEQCGYGVYVDGGSVIIRENDEARVIMAPSMGRWLVWSGKGEADYAKTHAEARAIAIRWLENEHGCLYWPKGRGGVFLTQSQMATFSQEWKELFREMAERGYTVRQNHEVTMPGYWALEIRKGETQVIFYLDKSRWVVWVFSAVMNGADVFRTDETAMEFIRDMFAQVEQEEAGAA